MADLRCKIVPGGMVPFGDEAEAWFKKQAIGSIANVTVSRMRNYQFFKKWWALVKLAFDHWDACEFKNDHGAVKPCFDRFRKDVTIMAGLYEQSIRLDGSVRVEAASLAWGSMTEEAFTDLYERTVDVLLKKVLLTYSREDLDDVVNEITAFAA